MKLPRKGRASDRKAARPAPGPAVRPPRPSLRAEPGPGADDGPEGEDAGMPLEEAEGVTGPGQSSNGAETEEGRHIMELLERHQEHADSPPPRRGRLPLPMRFEVVEHTADVGIKAYGDTLNEAFENAALGMFNIMTDPSKVGLQQDFEVMIEGEDLKSLLHEWLSQLLILSQVNGMLFGGFRVEMKPLTYGLGLTGWAIGEPADPARHVYKTEIKAVTHHMLEVREKPPMVKVLFDI